MPEISAHQTEDRLKTTGTFYLQYNLFISTSLTSLQFDFGNRFLCLFVFLLICHVSLSKVTAQRINKFTATAAGRFPLPVLSNQREKKSISCIIYPPYFLFMLCRIMTTRKRNCWQPEVSASKCLIFFPVLWFQELCTSASIIRALLSEHFFFLSIDQLLYTADKYIKNTFCRGN